MISLLHALTFLLVDRGDSYPRCLPIGRPRDDHRGSRELPDDLEVKWHLAYRPEQAFRILEGCCQSIRAATGLQGWPVQAGQGSDYLPSGRSGQPPQVAGGVPERPAAARSAQAGSHARLSTAPREILEGCRHQPA